MNTVYFDTFVYNKVVDDKEIRDKIFYLKKNNHIEIIFSEYLFNEIVCTWGNGTREAQERVAELFRYVMELISRKILKQKETIIDEEIKAFLDNHSPKNIFFEKQQADQIFHAITKLAKGEPITNTSPIVECGKDKKETLNKIKDIIRKHNPKQMKFSMSFEEFHTSASAKGEESIIIDDLLSKIILKKPSCDLIEKVKTNITSLPYFKASLRMNSAYQYSFFLYKNKPLIGDDYDLRHFVSASDVDVLVCDRDFLKILKWAYPLKTCFTLDDFLKHYSYP